MFVHITTEKGFLPIWVKPDLKIENIGIHNFPALK